MSDAPPSNLNIVVIDDDSFMINVVTRLLESMGHKKVQSASNGKAAVETLAAASFDLVISDLKMPDMDGIELMRYLAKMEPCPSIILMSGVDKKILASAERLAEAHQLSLLGTMSKPLKRVELERLIGRIETKSKIAKKGPFESLPVEEVKEGIAAGRVMVYVQPKVIVPSKVVVGGEALARWKNDDGSVLGPGAFVPVAEKNGLMTELTDAVIDSTLAMMNDWPAIACNLKIGINVSIDNLSDVDFADRLIAKAKAAKVPLDRLVLEITETKIMETLKEPLDIMARLGMQGIGLAIDDFGTGASGFESLQTLPFTELKIDRAFVHGASKDAEKAAILQSIFAVAKRLEIATVAEGVEDQGDWELLEDMGCEIIQGFIIAKPMPPDEFAHWLVQYYAERDQAPVRPRI